MSWRQVASELGVSPSTLTRTKQGGRMEADGALGMAWWLGSSLEAFSQTNRDFAGAEMQVDAAEAGMLRLDTRALYRAVDDLRCSRALPWQSLASELGVAVSQLTRLSKGGRVGVRLLLTVTAWLGRSAESFARVTDR